jgi:hypothetical protein
MDSSGTLVASVLLAALPAFATAQGLGDAAARERAKRGEQAGPAQDSGKVYSNEDLAKVSKGSDTSQSEPAADQPSSEPSVERPEGAPASEGPDATTLIAQKKAREKEFEEAVEAARARVRELEERLRVQAERLNPMSVTFIYHRPQGTLDLSEEVRIKEEIEQLQVQIPAAKQDVVAAEEALIGFRNGRTDVVPGGKKQDAQNP